MCIHLLAITWNVGNRAADRSLIPNVTQLDWLSVRVIGCAQTPAPDLVIVGMQELHPILIPIYQNLFMQVLDEQLFSCVLAAHEDTYNALFIFSRKQADGQSVLEPSWSLSTIRYKPREDPLLDNKTLYSKGVVYAIVKTVHGRNLVVANCHLQVPSLHSSRIILGKMTQSPVVATSCP